MALEDLSITHRRTLVHAACVAAWSDLEVQPEERGIILDLCLQLALPQADWIRAQSWLDAPPPMLDPNLIPREHASLFVDALVRVIESDGRVDPAESETLGLIRELLGMEETEEA